jgi:UDP-N-acetylglucosamine transferase subunit ALG13
MTAQPKIVVTVGTDHHPFDRLVGWIDEWWADHPEAEVFVQRGQSRKSRHGNCRQLIPHDELCELFAGASVVVCHGGPATIMDVLAAGRLPIVVARDPERGEHVDAHQMRFADHLTRNKLAAVATTKAELFDAIDRALADPQVQSVAVRTGVSEGVARFADVVDDILKMPGRSGRR